MDLSPLPQAFFEQFEILGPLDRRADPSVFHARQIGLDRPVALKFLRPRKARSERGRREFLREGQILSRLRHPGIVRLIDVCNQAPYPYLVFDYLEGEDAKVHLATYRPLPFRTVFRILQGITAGVSYLHKEGIVHGNLKPENILLDPDGGVHLLDFGLASTVGEDFDDQEPVGSPAYMAPERFDGGPRKPTSDIYSLGILLFEFLTGRPPFRMREVDQMQKAHATAAVPIIRREFRLIPQQLDLVVQRCLAKDPRLRYQAAEDLDHDLADLATFAVLWAEDIAGSEVDPEDHPAEGPQGGEGTDPGDQASGVSPLGDTTRMSMSGVIPRPKRDAPSASQSPVPGGGLYEAFLEPLTDPASERSLGVRPELATSSAAARVTEVLARLRRPRPGSGGLALGALGAWLALLILVGAPSPGNPRYGGSLELSLGLTGSHRGSQLVEAWSLGVTRIAASVTGVKGGSSRIGARLDGRIYLRDGSSGTVIDEETGRGLGLVDLGQPLASIIPRGERVYWFGQQGRVRITSADGASPDTVGNFEGGYRLLRPPLFHGGQFLLAVDSGGESRIEVRSESGFGVIGSIELPGTIRGELVAHGDRVYVGTEDRLLAVEMSRGRVWQASLLSPVSSGPHLTDDALIVGQDDGTLSVFDLQGKPRIKRHGVPGQGRVRGVTPCDGGILVVWDHELARLRTGDLTTVWNRALDRPPVAVRLVGIHTVVLADATGAIDLIEPESGSIHHRIRVHEGLADLTGFGGSIQILDGKGNLLLIR